MGKVKSILSDQRGMAMLITIMTISLLVSVTLIFHRKSWQSYLVANNYKVDSQLKAIGDSGINIGLALLYQDADKNNFDSLLDDWSVINKDELKSLFREGRLELKIVDLSGRLQINSLVQEKTKSQKEGGEQSEKNTEKEMREIFLRLLLSPVFAIEEESEASKIVDAVVDWIDKDGRESDNGAESGYYQGLKNPYECRNGPISSIEELLLVRGITPLLLFGGGEQKGLADFITVYGKDGKINLNTADSQLIKSLNPLIGDELIEKLSDFRTDKENEEQLVNPVWYTHIDSWPGDIVLNQKLLTVRSSFFLIQSVGSTDLLSRQVTATVNRVDSKTMKVVSRKVD